ncbi:Protein HASTY 1 [Linum perenne]
MENIQSLEYRHLRQLIHSVLVYFVKFCPPELWEAWLEKLLHPLFVHIHQVLSSSWSSLLHEGRAKAPDVQGIVSGSDFFILKHNSLALPALQICLEAFTWTDGESMTKVSSFCDVVVVLAISTRNLELQQFVCKDLFSSAIKGLALESNAIISADLISLCRDIFVHLCDRDPAPRQVLLSLPCISPHDLAAFEEALTKTSSSKEQKQHMRSLLMLATGNKLKALAAQKSVNTITNVTARYRSSAAAQETKIEDGEPVGLAAIM